MLRQPFWLGCVLAAGSVCSTSATAANPRQETVPAKPELAVKGEHCELKQVWWGQACAMVRQQQFIGFNRHNVSDERRLVIMDVVAQFPRGPSAVVASLLLYDAAGTAHAPLGFTIPSGTFEIRSLTRVRDKDGEFIVPLMFTKDGFLRAKDKPIELHPFDNGAMCYINPQTGKPSALANPSSFPGQLHFDLKTAGLSDKSTVWPGGPIRIVAVYEVAAKQPRYTLDLLKNVHVVWQSRHEIAPSDQERPATTRARSTSPSHLLPPHKSELNGPNEVRIVNPNSFSVIAGIRSGDSGKDFQIRAHGTASVRVSDGRYDMYFVYSHQPDAFFRGDALTLKGNGVEIHVVKVVGGYYEIRRVKRNGLRGIVLDVRFRFPAEAKWDERQIRIQAMQFILEQIAPTGRGVSKPKREAWFHRDASFLIAIPSAYFARQAAALRDSPFEKDKRASEAFKTISEQGKLDRTIFATNSDLAAILRRANVVLFDKAHHSGFAAVEIHYTATARGGYRIVGGPATGMPQGAIGLDAEITVTQGSKRVLTEKLPCQWSAKLDFVYSPAFDSKDRVAERLLDVLLETLEAP